MQPRQITRQTLLRVVDTLNQNVPSETHRYVLVQYREMYCSPKFVIVVLPTDPAQRNEALKNIRNYLAVFETIEN